MKMIALTGGIASGKSIVCKMFEECGAKVIYADQIAHQVYDKDTPLYHSIVDRYGQDVLDPAKNIDRKKLGEILFNSKKEKEWLESSIHPETRKLIEKEIKEAKQTNPPLILIEAALHVESEYYLLFEGLMVVHAGLEDQLQRLMTRDGISRDQALLRVENQLPLAEKLKKANWAIDNSGTLEATQKQVKELYGELIL